jgi:hypothetical protein
MELAVRSFHGFAWVIAIKTIPNIKFTNPKIPNMKRITPTQKTFPDIRPSKKEKPKKTQNNADIVTSAIIQSVENDSLLFFNTLTIIL